MTLFGFSSLHFLAAAGTALLNYFEVWFSFKMKYKYKSPVGNFACLGQFMQQILGLYINGKYSNTFDIPISECGKEGVIHLKQC